MEKLQWEIRVPMFRNFYLLRGLLLAIGLPFAALIALLLILSGGDVVHSDAKYALFMIGLLFLLTYLFILLFYGGAYAAGFVVDEEGVLNYTQKRQAKKNAVVNGLLMILGAFSGRPGTAGIGMMAAARQSVQIKWSAVRRVKYDPKRCTILLRGGPTQKIAVFCSPENYAAAETAIRRRTGIGG